MLAVQVEAAIFARTALLLLALPTLAIATLTLVAQPTAPFSVSLPLITLAEVIVVAAKCTRSWRSLP